MRYSLPTSWPEPAPSVVALDLDDAESVRAARARLRGPDQPRPQLHIDGSCLKCQRTLGVSHVVSELLLLHQAGASIWLRNANAPLRRCVQLLQLDALFHLDELDELPTDSGPLRRIH